ncbi:HEAT repeat domain-containing protein [Methanosarcina sp. Mfa9]|uniref:HEAT repeat domain-containing protein n=1 Tax=Methanosarcina sp. Mfa9 TaxID=3439063 RepID=UPI003F82F80F
MVDQEEIHRKCNSDNPEERGKAVDQLCSSFEYLSDKEQVGKDLHRLTSDQNSGVRSRAPEVIGTVFQYLPDKEQAWRDLIRLTSDEKSHVRSRAIKALRTVFRSLPDKEQAWGDLHKLTTDEKNDVRKGVAEILKTVFRDVPDKGQAGEDLHRLTSDQNSEVRKGAAETLGTAFQDMPDKEKAGEDLHRLTSDQNSEVRDSAVVAFKTAFQDVPDKERAWKDLIRFTLHEDRYVREKVADALGNVFQYVQDKEKAWEDLHRLTSDQNSEVRWGAVEALGTCFLYVPGKERAWKDLHKLTSDQEGYVRVRAYHSLGRISIYKASQSDNEEAYLEELKKAIDFFENAAKEPALDNPSKFCFPFYRSFYTIISIEKREARDEVEKYLAEAKGEIGWSDNKKLLFEAIENLANALKEVQNLENMDLAAKKGELNFYRKYCEQAAELMKNTEEKAPSATIVMRKGLPILDRNLKSLLDEIQEKAKKACQVSKGTDTEKIACAVSREVQKWEIGSQEEMSWYVENLVFSLAATIPQVPENNLIFDRIEQMRNQKDLVKQYGILCTIIPLIPNLYLGNKIEDLEKKIDCFLVSLSESNTDLTISTGIDFYGNGIKLNKKIPLQSFSESERKEIEEIIGGKEAIKLMNFPSKIVGKIKDWLARNR